MEGKKLIDTISLQNFLSFGSGAQKIELHPLNVLIGPNASGKSNFIEVFRFLNAIPRDPARVIREGGGVHEFLYKGAGAIDTASIEARLKSDIADRKLRYQINFTNRGNNFHLIKEEITYEHWIDGEESV